ncbi:unnamed protein product, partial [Phaeothamnion confervicola]
GVGAFERDAAEAAGSGGGVGNGGGGSSGAGAASRDRGTSLRSRGGAAGKAAPAAAKPASSRPDRRDRTGKRPAATAAAAAETPATGSRFWFYTSSDIVREGGYEIEKVVRLCKQMRHRLLLEDEVSVLDHVRDNGDLQDVSAIRKVIDDQRRKVLKQIELLGRAA